MIEGIVFVLKGIILTEVLTNATREWGIFDIPRKWIKRNAFFKDLLDCFECSSVWVGSFVISYLSWFEIPIFTYILIFHRGACFLQSAWLNADWSRANKEQDFQNKIKGGK